MPPPGLRRWSLTAQYPDTPPAVGPAGLMDSVSIYSLSYNSTVKRPSNKPSVSRADDDPLTRFAGPSETVAASVPRALTAAIRAKVGKREFSRFVGRALARELVDQNRAAYVASFEKDHGPVDPQLTARLEALFAR
jgi:hypothetical protein